MNDKKSDLPTNYSYRLIGKILDKTRQYGVITRWEYCKATKVIKFMSWPDLPKDVPIEIIVDDENYTVGYYARGFWSPQSVAIAVQEEYAREREGFEHGYFRFIPRGSESSKFMEIKQERTPKRGNFPVTYYWY